MDSQFVGTVDYYSFGMELVVQACDKRIHNLAFGGVLEDRCSEEIIAPEASWNPRPPQRSAPR